MLGCVHFFSPLAQKTISQPSGVAALDLACWFLSLKNHTLLPVTQFMKITISYILRSLLVVYCVKATSTVVDYSWKSIIMYFTFPYIIDPNYMFYAFSMHLEFRGDF